MCTEYLYCKRAHGHYSGYDVRTGLRNGRNDWRNTKNVIS